MPTPRWDIFCKVVDNFGDAGVCWRLVRQLAAEHALDVCLWIDRVDVLASLWPELDAGQVTQCIEGVTVCRWQADSLPREDAAVVIEAFACDLPDAAVEAMAGRERPPLWINLEYLSAEPWVGESHALWSVHAASGLRKLFFFPGFAAATGGLLRERDLEARRQAFLAAGRELFLQALGVPFDAQARYASVFTYPDAPLAGWLESLAAGQQPWVCLMPAGCGDDAVASVFGMPLRDHPLKKGPLTVVGLPFLAQDDYDRLLWACDFNAVRGEDSFVRAQWAGRPLLWQPYRQAEAAHEAKLEAFLSRYTAVWPSGEAADAMVALHRHWSAGEWHSQAWDAVLGQWPACCQGAGAWREQQAKLPDLASKLVQFYSDWL